MSNIKLGDNTLTGVTSVKIPLADGSGNATFIEGGVSFPEKYILIQGDGTNWSGTITLNFYNSLSQVATSKIIDLSTLESTNLNIIDCSELSFTIYDDYQLGTPTLTNVISDISALEPYYKVGAVLTRPDSSGNIEYWAGYGGSSAITQSGYRGAWYKTSYQGAAVPSAWQANQSASAFASSRLKLGDIVLSIRLYSYENE